MYIFIFLDFLFYENYTKYVIIISSTTYHQSHEDIFFFKNKDLKFQMSLNVWSSYIKDFNQFNLENFKVERRT